MVYKGATFHVQTEDWGTSNPFLVSQIFCRGEVLKSIKIPYTKVLPSSKNLQPGLVRFALETQHNSILDLLVSGQLI